MSSPVGHSFAGYIIYVYSSRTLGVTDIKALFLFILVSNAPDLDFIPGLLLGKPNLFHHGISHSIAIGIILAIFLSSLPKMYEIVNERQRFLIYSTLYCSHLFLDYISVDSRLPFGIPVFWPFSSEYFIISYPLLPPIIHGEMTNAGIRQFFSSIFSIQNLYAIFMELAVMLPIMLTVWMFVRTRYSEVN